MFGANEWMWGMLGCIIVLVVLLKRRALGREELYNQIEAKYQEVFQEYKKTVFLALYNKLKVLSFEKDDHMDDGLWNGITQDPNKEIQNNYHQSLRGIFETSTNYPPEYKHHIRRLLSVWSEQRHLMGTLRNSKRRALEEKLLEMYNFEKSELSTTEMLLIIAKEDWHIEQCVNEMLTLIDNLYKNTTEE